MKKNQMVRLTWRNTKNEVIVEFCELVHENADIYAGKVKITGDLINRLAKMNYVLFEDYEGVFGLKPEQIISIEPMNKE